MVIRYAYLWADEHAAERVEGAKDRPAVLVAVRELKNGDLQVLALPVTHSPPRRAPDAMEIPPVVKRRLKLDDSRSWVKLTEANIFTWPGVDLRSVLPGAFDPVYGFLPGGLTERVIEALLANIKEGKVRKVPRTE